MGEEIGDLRDVLHFISSELGEPSIHLIGHGYGGALLMEALLRARIYATSASTADDGALPALRSVCLFGTASSTAIMREEACRLMARVEAALFDTPDDLPTSFWMRHVCGLKPQPACLAESYAESFPGPGGGRWGVLAGWVWMDAVDPEGEPRAAWRLRLSGALQSWQLTRQEVAESYWAATGGAPLLSIRGEHDFVTDACAEAWRGVADAAKANGVARRHAFREAAVNGCGHHAHLEDPDVVSAKLRLWFLEAEEKRALAPSASPSPSSADGRAEGGCGRDDLESGAAMLGDRLQLLCSQEARRYLADWASTLSWGAYLSAARGPGGARPSRFAEPGFSGAGVASHLDGRSSAREVRRLAEWAWSLPAGSLPPSCSGSSVAEALRSCADAVGGERAEGPQRVAVGFLSDDRTTVQAIICVQAADLRVGVTAVQRASLDIIGAVGSPSAPAEVTSALVGYVRDLIASATAAAAEL